MNSTLKHPLLTASTIFEINWEEWKSWWNKELPAILRYSLLEFGLRISFYNEAEYAEQICFYLDVADGHTDSQRFREVKRDRYPLNTAFSVGRIEPDKAQQILSRKAFEVLAEKLFKSTTPKHEVPFWLCDVFMPGVFEKVIWFFRLEKKYLRREIVNLVAPDHAHGQDRLAREFLFELCKLGWEYEHRCRTSYRRRVDDEILSRFAEARPFFVEALYGLDKLSYFLGREAMVSFDDEESGQICEVLERLALEKELYLPDPDTARSGCASRHPKTIKEACFGGSEAARTLLLLQVKNGERKRFQKLEELEQKRRQLEKSKQELALEGA